jgi:hypothetical protein
VGIGGPTQTPTRATLHPPATSIFYAGRAQVHRRYLTHVGYPTGSNMECTNYGIGQGGGEQGGELHVTTQECLQCGPSQHPFHNPILFPPPLGVQQLPSHHL